MVRNWTEDAGKEGHGALKITTNDNPAEEKKMEPET
jgi:hypothetical protein